MPIRLQGRVLKRCEIDNRRIILRGTRDDEVIRGQFKLYAPYGDDICIQKVESSNPVHLEIHHSEPSKEGSIIVEISYRHSNPNRTLIHERVVVQATVGGNLYSEEVLVLVLPHKN